MTADASRSATLCVVAPCHDEAAGIAAFHAALVAVFERLPDLACEVIYVDDGSSDGTLAALDALAATDPRVRVAALSRNFGHQVALTAGCDLADADAVVLMDSDLQHPPALIPELVARWRAGAEVVSAVRRSTADASPFKRASAALFYGLINQLSDTHVVPGAADFVLLARPAHEALKRMPERHRFLRGMVSWIGFRREYVPFDAPARATGRSSYTLTRMRRLASDAVFSFSTAPVRLATRLGLAVVACGLAYLVYVLVVLFVAPDRIVPGWTSLVVVVLILGGAQILFTGLIGEYVARIFEEAKGRPLYVLRREFPARRDARGA